MMLTRDETRGGTAAASAELLEARATAGRWLARLWARLKKEFAGVVENRMSMERRQLAHRFKND